MRQAIQNLEESKIREVANAGMGRTDVLAFWFGRAMRSRPVSSARRRSTPPEGRDLQLPTTWACRAAGGDRCLHEPPARPGGVDRIAVTSGGVNALMLAMQALVDAGDEVVAVTPVWPNLTAQPLILGPGSGRYPAATRAGAWTLDLRRPAGGGDAPPPGCWC